MLGVRIQNLGSRSGVTTNARTSSRLNLGALHQHGVVAKKKSLMDCLLYFFRWTVCGDPVDFCFAFLYVFIWYDIPYCFAFSRFAFLSTATRLCEPCVCIRFSVFILILREDTLFERMLFFLEVCQEQADPSLTIRLLFFTVVTVVWAYVWSSLPLQT